jgi:hypothetical protein
MVDPITLAAIGGAVSGLFGTAATGGAATAIGAGVEGAAALGGAAGLSALDKPKSQAPLPSLPPAAPPIQSPVGSQTSNIQSGVGPSFLAAAATPSAGQTTGQRSLLGQ